MKRLVILLLLIPSLGFADKLIIGGFSEHIGSPVPLNETHPAIGIERNGFEVGIYYNSLERISAAVSVIRRPWVIGSLDAGFRLGVASGYPDTTKEGFDGRMYEMDGNVGGLMPQIQFILSKKVKNVTVDAGFSYVSSLTFKVDI